jgi:transcriptional regulator GlxA family with amidase domain
MKRIRVGILGYDGVAAINVVGPLEAFSNAFRGMNGEQSPCYEVFIIGCKRDEFVTDTGVRLHARFTGRLSPALDTVIIPGGRGMHCPETVKEVCRWIKTNGTRSRRVASVCTGVYALASTGLVDGHRVTTHWQNAMDVANRFPKLHVEESAIVVKDRKFYSAAGATAGIDLALFLIAEDFGRDVAVSVARKLLVYIERDGGQEQYSEPAAPGPRVDLPTGENNISRLGQLVVWMNQHLSEDLRLEMLAKRAVLSKHDFIHQFTETFGVPPGLFVKNLRFNEARRRLMSGEKAATVARLVGFSDPAYFIQEFRRRFGMLPGDYQRRFGSSDASIPPADRRSGFTQRSSGPTRPPANQRRPRITSFTRCIRRHASPAPLLEQVPVGIGS